MVGATEGSAINGALPLVKIINPYRKAYSICCRPKNYVTNATATRTWDFSQLSSTSKRRNK